MKPYLRAERVSNRIRQAITELLARKMQDPRMDLATISHVKLSNDLKIARIYITIFGSQKRIRDAMDGFNNSKGFIKKRIAPKLGLKYMPELKFIYDDTFDKAARLDELIKSASSESHEDIF